MSGGFFDVELADSVNKLVGSVGKSNTVILSTVQKLLPKKSVNTGYNENDEIEAFSKSDKLLVIAEDSFGNRFGNKYRYIDARFPNARLMGITDEPKPFSGFTRYFGPLIYRYTYEQAIEDGYFSIAEYENAALLSDYNVTENVYYEGYSSLEREKRLAEFIASREKEQDRFVLVLCSETEQLISLYNALLAFTEEKKLRLYVPKLYLNSSYKSDDIPDSAIWDGKYFSGILITRTLPAVDMDCSTVYLDKKPTSFELGQVLCMLAGRGKKRKKAGALIDFRNSWNIMQTLFPDGLPLALKSSQYRIGDAKLSVSLKLLSEALKTHSYAKAKAVLEIIRNSFPDKGNDLSQQLEFIFSGNMDAEQLKSYWHRHISELAWKCDMWCALSVDSTCCWEKSAETEVISDTAYTAEQIEVTPLPPTGSSQERGALLERQTKQLIRELFDLSEEYSLEELCLQTSGTQFGFDITFT